MKFVFVVAIVIIVFVVLLDSLGVLLGSCKKYVTPKNRNFIPPPPITE